MVCYPARLVRRCASLCGVVRVDERAEYISIAEAATLLGVHRNTIRNRIKAGRYKAHKLVTPQGETYAIARESLDLRGDTPTTGAAQPLSGPVRHNADNPPQPAALVSPEQQAQADAIVQRLLAPFIAELGTVREGLGRVQAERDARDETIAALCRRAEVAEATRDRLQAAQEAPAVRGPAPAPAAGPWARLRAWWVRVSRSSR